MGESIVQALRRVPAASEFGKAFHKWRKSPDPVALSMLKIRALSEKDAIIVAVLSAGIFLDLKYSAIFNKVFDELSMLSPETVKAEFQKEEIELNLKHVSELISPKSNRRVVTRSFTSPSNRSKYRSQVAGETVECFRSFRR